MGVGARRPRGMSHSGRLRTPISFSLVSIVLGWENSEHNITVNITFTCDTDLPPSSYTSTAHISTPRLTTELDFVPTLFPSPPSVPTVRPAPFPRYPGLPHPVPHTVAEFCHLNLTLSHTRRHYSSNAPAPPAPDRLEHARITVGVGGRGREKGICDTASSTLLTCRPM